MDSSTYSVARSSASESRSIAERTACSAASEYGGVRSRYGSRAAPTSLLRAVEYESGELDIFPGWSFPGGVSQQCCRMIRDDERDAVVPVNCTTKLADRRLCLQESLGGKCPERQNHLRFDQLDLAHQV